MQDSFCGPWSHPCDGNVHHAGLAGLAMCHVGCSKLRREVVLWVLQLPHLWSGCGTNKHWWVGMAAHIRDCLHPREVGLCWMNDWRASCEASPSSWLQRILQKINKTEIFYYVWKAIMYKLSPPQFVLSWEETGTCCHIWNTLVVHPIPCEQQSGSIEWQVGLWPPAEPHLPFVQHSFLRMCFLLNSGCDVYFCSFLRKNRWP